LAGLPLGRILRQGRAESFVVRDLLKSWCESGILRKVEPHDPHEDGQGGGAKQHRNWLKLGLRSTPLTVLAIAVLGTGIWLRWTAVPRPDPLFGHDLRTAQIRYEVIEAARLFRYQQGQWPESLAELVRNGQISDRTLDTVTSLGWTYTLDRKQDQFTLG
jgi:hypothetical protein